ncbi:MAG: hypothetical protein ABJF01_06840 [bacterium]
MPMPSRLYVLYALGIAAAGCGKAGLPAPPPQPAEHSLSGLAAQHIAVLPTYSVRIMPGLDWGSSVGRLTDAQRTLDADILSAFDERAMRKNWIFPSDLQAAYKRNSTYAADPYELAEEPLRSPSLGVDSKLPDPLASQLRTLIAFHQDARYVLAPVELRFEKAGTGGRGVLRLVLIDPRLSNVRWIGEISSDSFPQFGPAISAGLAAKLANVVATP